MGLQPGPGCAAARSRRVAMLLDGRSVVAFTDYSASIPCRGGHRLSYYRAPLDGAVLPFLREAAAFPLPFDRPWQPSLILCDAERAFELDFNLSGKRRGGRLASPN